MLEDEHRYDGIDRRAPAGWSFKREISVGNLLTLAALAAPLMVWAITLDKRLTLLETLLMTQQRNDDRQEQMVVEIKREIRQELSALNSKVDRILERNGSGTVK